MNLIEALQARAAESREFLAELEETAKLLGHTSAATAPGLGISKALHDGIIRRCEAAIASGDTVEMVKVGAALGVGK